MAYLIADRLPAASVQNAASRYIVPNLSAIAAAANTVHGIPANNELQITNPGRGQGAIPDLRLHVRDRAENASQGALLRQFIGYAITGGQQFSPRLDYVPIPGFVRSADQNTLNRVQ